MIARAFYMFFTMTERYGLSTFPAELIRSRPMSSYVGTSLETTKLLLLVLLQECCTYSRVDIDTL